jgi:hypothetical protein
MQSLGSASTEIKRMQNITNDKMLLTLFASEYGIESSKLAR